MPTNPIASSRLIPDGVAANNPIDAHILRLDTHLRGHHSNCALSLRSTWELLWIPLTADVLCIGGEVRLQDFELFSQRR